MILGEKLSNGSSNATAFVFTFEDAGVYVFADSNNSAKITIISVMSASQQCPSNTKYTSMTQANLLKVGISLRKNIVYTPDWGFFIGAVAAILGLITMSVFTIGYVVRKSWKSPYARISNIDDLVKPHKNPIVY